MDYYSNGSIIKCVNSGNFIPLPNAINYTIDILRGLEYLHELDLYHNDIKPQNILIGSSEQGVLTDYGISCQALPDAGTYSDNFYKLHAAPEILTNKLINVQTDIYQVGITMFRLLNGIGTIQAKYNKLGEDSFYRLTKIGKLVCDGDYQLFLPSRLKTIINRAMHVDTAKRYKSAVEMRRDLERFKYLGYWTCTPKGYFIGKNCNGSFRFEENTVGLNSFNFNALKKNKLSNRETRVIDYCARKISLKDLQNLKKRFMQWVVTG
jgi:serine/threonine protein kinase